jgi:hypothetical protein
MVRFFIYCFTVIILLCNTGCGTTKQAVYFPDQNKLVEEQGKGRIYVIGSPLLGYMASYTITTTILANKKWIGDIVGHSYLCWEQEPGVAVISGRRIKSNIVDFNVVSGQAYFVIAHIVPINFLNGTMSVRFEIVSEEDGKKALLDAKPPEQSENQ